MKWSDFFRANPEAAGPQRAAVQRPFGDGVLTLANPRRTLCPLTPPCCASPWRRRSPPPIRPLTPGGATPLRLFLGSAAFRPTGAGWEPIHLAEVGRDEWLRMVYSDRTWVAQVAERDAADATGPVSGSPTSSATLPSLVVRTAQVAEVRPGQKVLEVGTGTGYLHRCPVPPPRGPGTL